LLKPQAQAPTQDVVGGRVVFVAEGVVEVALAAVQRLGDAVNGQVGVPQVLADVGADAVAEGLELCGPGLTPGQFLQRQAHQFQDGAARPAGGVAGHAGQFPEGAAHGVQCHP
jgi:hypothetical protein